MPASNRETLIRRARSGKPVMGSDLVDLIDTMYFLHDKANPPSKVASAAPSVQWSQINAPKAFPPAPHTHAWSDLTGVPEFGAAWENVTGKPDTATRWPTWDEVISKPTTFAPAPHVHAISDVTGLQTALNGKEPTIATGTTAQYWRGDKSWQALSTTVVPEGTNLYWTNARGDARITLQKGTANGLATLDGAGKVPLSQLPATTIVDTFVVASQTAMLALVAQQGDVCVRTDLNKTFILKADPATTLANWQEMLSPTDSVTSVFGRIGVVTAQASDYSSFYQPLDADLTSIAALTTTAYGRGFLTQADAAAARTYIGAQAAGSYAPAAHSHVIADVTGLQGALDGKYGVTAGSVHAPGSFSVTYPTLAVGDGQYGFSAYSGIGHIYSANGRIDIRSRLGGADAVYVGQVATREWANGAFALASHTHAYEPTIAGSAATNYWCGDKVWRAFPTTWAWANLTGVPSTFTPSAHTHNEITLSRIAIDTYSAEDTLTWENRNGRGNHFGRIHGVQSAPAYFNYVHLRESTGTVWGAFGYSADGKWYVVKGASGSGPGTYESIWTSGNLTGTRNEHNHAGLYQPVGSYASSSHTHSEIMINGASPSSSGAPSAWAGSGLYFSSVYAQDYPSSYGNVLSLRGTGGNQIYMGWSGTNAGAEGMWIRNKRDNYDGWSPWQKVYTSADFNPNSYLPLAGGTMIGGIGSAGVKHSFAKDVAPSLGGNTDYASGPLEIQRQAGSGTTYSAGIGFHNPGVNAAFLYYDAAAAEFQFNRHVGGIYRFWHSGNLVGTRNEHDHAGVYQPVGNYAFRDQSNIFTASQTFNAPVNVGPGSHTAVDTLSFGRNSISRTPSAMLCGIVNATVNCASAGPWYDLLGTAKLAKRRFPANFLSIGDRIRIVCQVRALSSAGALYLRVRVGTGAIYELTQNYMSATPSNPYIVTFDLVVTNTGPTASMDVIGQIIGASSWSTVGFGSLSQSFPSNAQVPITIDVACSTAAAIVETRFTSIEFSQDL